MKRELKRDRDAKTAVFNALNTIRLYPDARLIGGFDTARFTREVEAFRQAAADQGYELDVRADGVYLGAPHSAS